MHGTRKAKTPSEIRIKRAENGGVIVTHEYDNFGSGESYQPSKQHAFGDHHKAMGHVMKTMGGRPATPEQKAAPSKAAGKKAAHKRGAGVD